MVQLLTYHLEPGLRLSVYWGQRPQSPRFYALDTSFNHTQPYVFTIVYVVVRSDATINRSCTS